jgi:hypothetical protein
MASVSPQIRTPAEEARRRRTLISQVLVAGLIAVAYSEPVGAVTQAFDKHGVNVKTLAWLIVYVATVLRFFVGDILHLEKADLVAPEAELRWFWDISFIVMQCIVLIFAGAVTTIYASATAGVTFVDYLLVLYALDVIWIVSVRTFHAFGTMSRSPTMFRLMVRKDDMPPVWWAVINIALGFTMWRFGLVARHPHITNYQLEAVLAANALAFVADVFLIRYGMRDHHAASSDVVAQPDAM